MKLFICGYARSGKDTAAEIIRLETGLTFKSSSMLSLEIFMFDLLKSKYGLNYETMSEAFEDRMNHREKWFSEISEYNADCRHRLSEAIFGMADVYVGIRNRQEFLASRHLSDLSIWIDAGPRLNDQSESSYIDMVVRKSDCDVVIDNSGTELDLKFKIERLCRTFKLE